MNQNQLDNDTAPRSVDQPQACSALLCLALNKLLWKTPMPASIAAQKEGALGLWAEHWLAALRDGPDGYRIESIRWDADSSEFVPAPNVQSSQREEKTMNNSTDNNRALGCGALGSRLSPAKSSLRAPK